MGCPPDAWPQRMAPRQLAVLQSTSPDDANAWKKAIEYAAENGSLPNVIQQFEMPIYVLSFPGQRPPPKIKDIPAVSAADFSRWLLSQNETPSTHIQAWFDATSPASEAGQVAPVVETQLQRQDRRLKACEDAGLDMKNGLLRLPDGVAEIAKRECATRQAFSRDLKAALARREAVERPNRTVHFH